MIALYIQHPYIVLEVHENGMISRIELEAWEVEAVIEALQEGIEVVRRLLN